MSLRNIYEIIIGSVILLFGIGVATIISNNITNFLFFNYLSKTPLNPIMIILIGFVHIVLLVIFTLVIRYVLLENIKNALIANTILGISGPLMGACSLFLAPVLGNLIKSIVIKI